ncbi:hypothetical protein [Natrinema soli]|uniref:Uncharacterized protein n=1 Tax=Natrinema soli TaxID=1930624 RepID=A0ABD5SRJ3_9EURY|nr:hypothetical protein [Natrinema soli]
MPMVCDYDHVAQRAEQLEREGAREMRKLAEAKATAGPEHVTPVEGEILVADGGQQDQGPINVGDHVQDEQDPDATMVVVNLDTLQADAYEIEVGGPTIADLNPEYPPKDDVVEVVYPQRTDLNLEDKKTYAFPKGRLEVVSSVHDRDGDEEGEE